MSLVVCILSAIGEILTVKMAKADNPLIYCKQKIPVGNRAEGPRVPWVSLRATHGYTMDNPLRGMCPPRFSPVMRNGSHDFPLRGMCAAGFSPGGEKYR